MKYLFSIGLIYLVVLITPKAQGQNLTKAEQKFLQKQAKSVTTTKDFAEANWKMIDKAIKGKQIVALGEFNHGAKEVFYLRNKLIKYLHQKHQFRVILFESGIGELAWIDLKKSQLTPRQMTYGFLGGWRNQAFQELMQYVKENKLSVGGFDVQRFGGDFTHLLKDVATQHSLDTALYASLEKRFTSVSRALKSRKTQYEAIQPATDQLIQDYRQLLNALTIYNKKESKTLPIVRQTLLNRVHYLNFRLKFVQKKNWHQRWIARDSAMANNVMWLADNVFKGQKIILVAHNFHVAKFNQKEEVMGEFLAKKYGDQMYVLGAFAAKGSYHGNYGNTRKMKAPDTKASDLKHYINALPDYAYFLPIPKKKTKGNQWLFKPIIVNDTFINLNGGKKMVLAAYFDGLLLLDRVSPPEEKK
ncbi:MAG TPA: hypothetical protein DCS93_17680 [Microscillaceae bacterium]|nr:hypothetical protein [Microscillaceae bacterium]